MSFWQRIVDYFFPVKCASCKTLVSRSEGLLCEACREAYHEATMRNCPLCVMPMIECDCPNRYMERNHLHSVVKLYRYRQGESDSAENGLIFRLKKTTDITVVQFLAEELVPGVKRHICDSRSYVLVGVPRSKKAIRKNGGDHVMLLCRELSRRLEIPYIPAVCRRKSGKAQKTMRRAERITSAMKSFSPQKNVDLKGKTVILVDDVVTSGASLVACAKVVRHMGAKTVICVTVGAAFRYRDLLKDSIFYSERRSKYGV